MKILTIQLLILIAFLEKAQQVTLSDNKKCNEQQYSHPTLEKCCSRCAPGNYMKKECTETSDTECQPCEDGRFTSNWNYAEKCMSCKSCDPPLVEKEKCSRTKKEQCGCPDGYSCSQYSGMGRCMVCKPDFIPTTVPLPPEPSTTQPSIDYPQWIIPIIITIFTVFAILLLFFIYRKMSVIREKIGCMTKIKKPLPESDPEVVGTSLITQKLSFPTEETDPLQSAEYAP